MLSNEEKTVISKSADLRTKFKSSFSRLGNYRFPAYKVMLSKLVYVHLVRVRSPAILDAGCGRNISGSIHLPENAIYIGIDISLRNIVDSREEARTRKGSFSFVNASITDLPFPSKSFDMVLCLDVLEHLKARHRAIVEVSRVCRSEFVGCTTNLLSPLMFLDSFLPSQTTQVILRKLQIEAYERHFRFTSKGLLRSLMKAGFRKIELEVIGGPPFPPKKFIEKKLPWFVFLWMVLDKLTSRLRLMFLKENIVFVASKHV